MRAVVVANARGRGMEHRPPCVCAYCGGRQRARERGSGHLQRWWKCSVTAKIPRNRAMDLLGGGAELTTSDQVILKPNGSIELTDKHAVPCKRLEDTCKRVRNHLKSPSDWKASNLHQENGEMLA